MGEHRSAGNPFARDPGTRYLSSTIGGGSARGNTRHDFNFSFQFYLLTVIQSIETFEIFRQRRSEQRAPGSHLERALDAIGRWQIAHRTVHTVNLVGQFTEQLSGRRAKTLKRDALTRWLRFHGLPTANEMHYGGTARYVICSGISTGRSGCLPSETSRNYTGIWGVTRDAGNAFGVLP